MDQAAEDSTAWVVKNEAQQDQNDTRSVYSQAPSHLSRLNNNDGTASKGKIDKNALALLNKEQPYADEKPMDQLSSISKRRGDTLS